MTDEEKKAIEELEDFIEDDEIQNISVFTAKKIKNIIENQQKEIEEKSTIIMVGAEKVKQLEKGNRSLMESRIKWKNRYYKEKAKNKECISKYKIREKIEELEGHGTFDAVIILRNLLKEDGDHIPRID